MTESRSPLHSLRELRAADALSALDVQLARTLCELAGETRASVQLAIALVSHQVERGHVCLSLPALALAPLSLWPAETVDPELCAWPALETWLAELRSSPLLGSPEQLTPLVLDHADRLYLRRHFSYERALSAELLRRIAEPDRVLAEGTLQAGLARLFGDDASDLQRKAGELALRRSLCVISGGPGTGKTATVVKILALVIEQALHAGGGLPRMHLLAPTGKAAARVRESIQNAKARLACSDVVRAAIPEEAATIHRALQQVTRSYSREPSEAPPELATDLVLVDEASMVDLALMARLFAVVPKQARVILLGDKHQLASVEAGAVLGDICGAGKSAAQLTHAPVVHLLRSYRYAADSGIGELARAINDGDAARALDVLRSKHHPDVELCPPARGPGLSARLRSDVIAGYTPCLSASDPREALTLFERFRVLCAHRTGSRGVAGLNAQLLRLFLERGLLTPAAMHFVHAPILVTENDYSSRLWNGDVGMLVQTTADSPLMAAFPPSGAVSGAADNAVRKIGLARLPLHECALAMSIHKSQGSEVDEVAIVLPLERSAVLTRELLYTAVTRAKKRVVIHASEALVKAAIETSVARSSGLADALYGPNVE